MSASDSEIDAARLAQQVKEACIAAALAGYEEASISGLCHEGAWEAAVAAIQRLDLDDVIRTYPCRRSTQA
ncbi:MAG TPA: hypothetical protein VFL95_04660 [Gemmatimonadales bacterium]|nr:hypothetical protein [Gemmatimonadales bacterium]